MTVSPTSMTYGSTGNTLTFTFTANIGDFGAGSQVAGVTERYGVRVRQPGPDHVLHRCGREEPPTHTVLPPLPGWVLDRRHNRGYRPAASTPG